MKFGSHEIESGEHRIRQRLLSAAFDRIACGGFKGPFLNELSDVTGTPLNVVRKFFRSDEDILIAIYSRFASDLESKVSDLPDGNLSERFRSLMNLKFDLMRPYHDGLRNIASVLAGRTAHSSVFGPETESIRVRVKGAISASIAGSSDHRGNKTDELAESLYSVYLSLMWLWLKDPSASNSRANFLLDAVQRSLSVTSPVLRSRAMRLPLRVFNSLQRSALFARDPVADDIAIKILGLVFKHRRLLPSAGACSHDPCERCFALHVPKVVYHVRMNMPIHLVLPAFPAKSPNRRKTLGTMPDMAEEQALIYLHKLCEEVREVYRPGVRLTICSDGHVFSDLVGVSDDDVTRYSEKIREMIAGLEFESNIDTFALPDLYAESDNNLVRRHLIRHYAQSLVAVRERAGISKDAAALINGIHRFLFEDQVSLYPELSRSRVRSECRSLAYEVVQRSDAWGRLLSDCFPMALRLSIHPQNPHSEKIGILLGPSDDIWLTPWHAVAVKVGESFKLMHRRDAEEIGAGPVTPSGFAEPYYYELRN